MEITGPDAWIRNARAAVQILRAKQPPAPALPQAADFPEVPAGRSGLRHWDQTQSIEASETKGTIINRYL